MTYELAKKLKDAGFPQSNHILEWELDKIPLHGVGYHLTADDLDTDDNRQLLNKARYTSIYSKDWILSEDGLAHTVYVPTLSELISACGGGFQGLFPSIWEGVSTWIAVEQIGRINEYGLWSHWTLWGGETPEEAVAKLWLRLQEEKGFPELIKQLKEK